MKGNKSPYIGTKDMNISDGQTKNEAVMKNKELEKTWSRFDVMFLDKEEHHIIKQLDDHMCGAWCVSEIFNFHNGLLQEGEFIGIQTELMEVEIRKRMCKFALEYMDSYLELYKDDDVMDEIEELRNSQSFSTLQTNEDEKKNTPKTIPSTQDSELPLHATGQTTTTTNTATANTPESKDAALQAPPTGMTHSPEEKATASIMMRMNLDHSPIKRRDITSSGGTCYKSVEHICDPLSTCVWCTRFYPTDTTASNYCMVSFSTQYMEVGLFAIDNIASESVICEYFGKIIEGTPGGFYNASLGEGIYIDASDVDSLGKKINHSCQPNCKLSKVMVNGSKGDDDNGDGETKLYIIAIKDIMKGDELTFHYNHGKNDDSLLDFFPEGCCTCILCKSKPTDNRKRKMDDTITTASSTTKRTGKKLRRLPTRKGGKEPRNVTESSVLARAIFYDYGLMNDEAKDRAFIAKHDDLLQNMSLKFPNITSKDSIDVGKVQDQDYSYEDNERKPDQQHNTRTSSGVTLKPSTCIKLFRDDEKNPIIVRKCYDAILDIVSRSFCPINGHSMDDLFHFVQTLLMKYKVYVCEKSVEQKRRQITKTVYRIVGFVIVEEHFKFDDKGKDKGMVIHLLATVPEARSTGVATLLLQRITKVRGKGMKNYPVIALMYPNIMLPLQVEHNV
jgi:hypothetical protein